MDTISTFDETGFPLDVLWLDIEYTSDRKWFTWNSTTFPDPIKLLDWVDAQGHRKLVPISDPHIKTDPDYSVSVIYYIIKHGIFFIRQDIFLLLFVYLEEIF